MDELGGAFANQAYSEQLVILPREDHLISGFLPGQAAFNGAKFHTLPDSSKDAPVSFSISSNRDWNTSDNDVLRGDRVFDDAEFSN